MKFAAGAPRSSSSSIDSSFVQPPLSKLQRIIERMRRFEKDDEVHIVGPFYENVEQGDYKAPNLNNVESFFF